jgi:uncharacterized protein (DUF58 family)
MPSKSPEQSNGDRDATRELLRKVRKIEIHTRRMVNDLFSGEYHSSFRGQGMEFDEVREYQPGDDVRFIDWNVTARTGVPFIKKFREEREMTVLLVVDASPSLRFGSGSQTKAEQTAEIAAVLAFSAIANQDKVGQLFFTDRVERYIAPKKGRGHVLRLIRELLAFRPQGRGSDLATALEHVVRTQKRRAVVFVISDFWSNTYEHALSICARKHDTIAVQITDRREEIPVGAGLIRLADAETGQERWVDTDSVAWSKHVRRAALEFEEQFAAMLRRCGTDRIKLTAGESFVLELGQFFKRRARKYVWA